MTKTFQQALDELRADPEAPVQVTVEGLTLEVRVVPAPGARRTLAEVFAEIGPWEGETTDELLKLLADARREGAARNIAAG